MSLKLGRWKANVSGVEGDLILDSLNQENVLSGQLVLASMPPMIIQDFWDDTARSILFNPSRPISLELPNALVTLPVQFKGFLFSTPTNPELGQDII